MNTPAHAVVNLLLFRRSTREAHAAAIVVGALLPDLPMVLFYLEERIAGVSERTIWRHDYHSPGWQALFDTFHSFPLLALAWWGARRTGLRSVAVMFGSMFLHSCFDFPFHHSDAHRHFFPFSDWRFASPLSYWDPAWHGRLVGNLEILVVFAGGAWLLRTAGSAALRNSAIFVMFLYAAYWIFMALAWMR